MQDEHGKFDGDLLSEKSLSAIYLKHRPVGSASVRDYYYLISLSTVIALLIIFGDQDKDDLVSTVNDIVNIQLQCATGILGFLIAGYTIFISTIKPDQLKIMSERRHDKSNISILKYLNFTFIVVFFQLAVFLFFLTSCKFLIYKGSSLISIFGFLCHHKGDVVFVNCIFIVLGVWSLAIILYLKSFVFNVHASCMLITELQVGSEDSENLNEDHR